MFIGQKMCTLKLPMPKIMLNTIFCCASDIFGKYFYTDTKLFVKGSCNSQRTVLILKYYKLISPKQSYRIENRLETIIG